MKIGLGTIPVLGIVAVGALALVGELPGMTAENNPDISGSARVIDGDTLAIGDERIRLAGIDAPESGQDCKDADGRAWACGAAATAWMHKAVQSRPVACHTDERDRYGRLIGRCSSDGLDLNSGLLEAGLAVSYMGTWRDELNELSARFKGKGIWQGEFIEPADYRTGTR